MNTDCDICFPPKCYFLHLERNTASTGQQIQSSLQCYIEDCYIRAYDAAVTETFI